MITATSSRTTLAAACLACWAVLALVPVAHAAADPALDQANQAYTQGRYEQAAADYERLLAQRGYSAPVLFDLANAYVRLGRIGPAILDYERAQVLAPADPDVIANLRFARQAASLYDPQPAWHQRAARALSLNAWSWLCSAGLLALCVGLLLRGPARRARPLLTALALSGAVALSGAGGAILIERPTLARAVVMAKDAPALLSPFDSARPLFSLPEGDLVQVRQIHGGYALIAAGNGRTGWMSLSQVRAVIPGRG